MGIWPYLGDNFWDFQRTKSEIQRQNQKRSRRGEKEDQKMRCNTHFFSHFSLKLGKTDINWEKLVKEAQKWPKNDVYPRKHTFSQKWLKHYFLPNFSSRGQFFLECRYGPNTWHPTRCYSRVIKITIFIKIKTQPTGFFLGWFGYFGSWMIW